VLLFRILKGPKVTSDRETSAKLGCHYKIFLLRTSQPECQLLKGEALKLLVAVCRLLMPNSWRRLYPPVTTLTLISFAKNSNVSTAKIGSVPDELIECRRRATIFSAKSRAKVSSLLATRLTRCGRFSTCVAIAVPASAPTAPLLVLGARVDIRDLSVGTAGLHELFGVNRSYHSRFQSKRGLKLPSRS
jgi:hypothetical protein